MGSHQRRRSSLLLLMLVGLVFLVSAPLGITAARIIAREGASDDDVPRLPAELVVSSVGGPGGAGAAGRGDPSARNGQWSRWPTAPGWDGRRSGSDAGGDARDGLDRGRAVEDPNWSSTAAGAPGATPPGGDPAAGGPPAKHAAGEPMLSGPPGRATPVAPPQSGEVHVDWDYQMGGGVFHCSTTLDIGAGGPDDLRRQVTVTTRDQAGRMLVTYSGTAFLDGDGALHVDARNSAVSGPWAPNWSPDSFAIDQYGQARTLDDFNRPGGGWATPSGS